MLFHILFQNPYKSDFHLLIWAENAKMAIEKAKPRIDHYHVNHDELEVLDQTEFTLKYPTGINFIFVLYKNGHGEKFCSIMTNSNEEAVSVFGKRFPGQTYSEILTHSAHIARQRAKMAENEVFFKPAKKQFKKSTKKLRPIKANGLVAVPYQPATA